jgi:hypothetical protein
MEKALRILAAVVILILSFGVALFLSIYVQSGHWTIRNHTVQFDHAFFLFWAGALALLFFIWTLSSRREAGRFGIDFESALRRGLIAALPLAGFLLAPWLARFYLTRYDLKVRLQLLAVFVLGAVIFLKLTDPARLSRKGPGIISRSIERFSSLSRRRRLLSLFLLSFLVYQLAAFILIAEGASFTGDEPFYLMTTVSLAKDADINLANNYAQHDYFSFYSKKDNPRLKLGIYGRYGRKGKDYIYPINLPGISVLIVPFYWLSRLFSGRWLTFILKTSLSVWASFLGLQVYLYARERWERERLSLGLWAVYSVSAPVLFFAIHLYPEVPIALLSLFIFRKVTGRGSLSLFSLISCGFLLGLFPWFGLKYSFFFWPLLLVSGYFLVNEHKAGPKIAAFVVPALVLMGLFYVFVHDMYGTFSPIAVYEGMMTPERAEAFKQTLLDIPWRARVDAFFDYFLDQRDGLLLYSPIYFFVFLGFVEIWRRRRRDFWFLLFIGLPFLLNYALFTHRQGASPQGRVLTPLSWIGAIALGYFLVYNRRKIFGFLFGVAAAGGAVIAGLLLAHPSFLYQPTTHEFTTRPGDLFVHLSNVRFFLPPLLPSFIKVDNLRYWPNYIWAAALFIFILTYALSHRERGLAGAVPAVTTFGLLAAALFLWVVFPRPVLYPARTIQYSPQRALGFYTFPAGKGVVLKDKGDLYLHFEKSYTLLLGSRAPLNKLKLVFGSEKGEYEVRLTLFDLSIYQGQTSYRTDELVFQPKAYYHLRNLYIYQIQLELTHRSAESMLVDPFFFQAIPGAD